MARSPGRTRPACARYFREGKAWPGPHDEFRRSRGLNVTMTSTEGNKMADVTFKRIDEMETLYHGVARRARAELGVSAWGMQVYELPPNWDGYPYHAHGDETEEAGQEEVYIPLAGSATLIADEASFELRP